MPRTRIVVKDPSGNVLERTHNGYFVNPKTKKRWYKKRGTRLEDNILIAVKRPMSAEHRKSISESMTTPKVTRATVEKIFRRAQREILALL